MNVKITMIDGKNDSKIPKVCVKSEDQTRQASGPVLSLVRVLSLVYGPVSQSIGVRFILRKKGAFRRISGSPCRIEMPYKLTP